jgi:hypothetical protein
MSRNTVIKAEREVAGGIEPSDRLRPPGGGDRPLMLHRLGYSLQANAEVTEGRQHPDRDAQFRYLSDLAAGFIGDDQPVISVDTKKTELSGEFANGGEERQPVGEPERVQVHDFADRALGDRAKAIPYGIYDLVNDEVWVSVGDTADTATFAVGVDPPMVESDGPGAGSPTPSGS